ncbi:MAG: hypothetical protein M0Z42_25905 [Actinomycetota bacterium]|jgi:hypothetical protein|nr:hypothetical protein [Actinomycetota bacterium]
MEEDLRLPFTERLSVRQWILIDVVVAAGLAAVSLGQIHHDHSPSLVGPGWNVVRYLAVASACVPLPFRRHAPMAVLAVVTLGVALLNALGVQGVVVISLALVAYSAASTSAIRTSLAAVVAAVVVSAVGGLAAPTGPGAGRSRLDGW